MSEDILERAKKADIDLMASTDWGQLRDLFGELIAEVEKWKKIAHKQARRAAGYRLAAKRHRREVERLRSENKIISDRAAHHDRQDAAEIELLAARIKELEALNELNHKNMRSWLDTTTDKEFLDKLSSEIGFKDAYIKRLEAAFLKSETERKFYTTINGMNSEFDWNGYPECPQNGIHKEGFRQQARDVLERIRKGELREAAINKLLSMKKLEVIEQIKEEIRSGKDDRSLSEVGLR